MKAVLSILLGAVAFAAAEPVCAACQTPETFRYVQWNIGHFAMGKSHTTTVTPERSAARAAEYRAKIAAIDADFIGVCEYDPTFDTARTPTPDAVFAGYPTRVIGPKNSYQSNAVFARRECLRYEVVDYTNRHQRCYFIDAVFKMGTNEVHVVQSHLDWNSNEKATDARPTQIRQLINRFRDVPYVIISADFNVMGAGEYCPFLMAGYALANCNRQVGVLETHPPSQSCPFLQRCLDNVVVKGFEVTDTRLDDVDYVLSDHRMVVCTLKMLDPVKSAKPRR